MLSFSKAAENILNRLQNVLLTEDSEVLPTRAPFEMYYILLSRMLLKVSFNTEDNVAQRRARTRTKFQISIVAREEKTLETYRTLTTI